MVSAPDFGSRGPTRGGIQLMTVRRFRHQFFIIIIIINNIIIIMYLSMTLYSEEVSANVMIQCKSCVITTYAQFMGLKKKKKKIQHFHVPRSTNGYKEYKTL